MQLPLFKKFTSVLAGSLAASGLALGTLVPAYAQSANAVRDTYGAWRMVCEVPPGAATEQCSLIQNVVSDQRAEAGLSVVVLKTADKQVHLLRVLAPLGVLLPLGIVVSIDGEDVGRAYFIRCFEDGCYAEVELDEATIDVLKKGSQATFAFFQSPEEGIGLPIDLTGFSAGFDALP